MKSTMRKEALLSTLRDNKEKHQATYDEAMGVWKQEVTDKLTKYLNDFTTKGSLPDGTYVKLQTKPVRYTESYDRAIKMIELNIDTNIVLEDEDFIKLVLDEWDWKDMFAANTTSYTASARGL